MWFPNICKEDGMKHFQRGIYGIISDLEKCRYQMSQNHSEVNANTVARMQALCGISPVIAAKDICFILMECWAVSP